MLLNFANAAPFSPLSIAPVFWTDPTRYLSTYTLSGSNIESAGDLSSSNIPAVQATPAIQPTIDTAGINSKPAIRFTSASSQYLEANAVAAFVTGDDKPMCVFLVFKQNSQSSQAVPLSFSNSSNINPLTFINQGNANTQILRRADSASGIFTSNFPTLTTGTNYVTCFNFNGTNVDTYLNNRSPFLNENVNVNAMTVNQFSIGCVTRASPSAFFDGWIGDVIVYNKYLSATERLAVMQYLGTKYGVTVA